MNNLPLVLFVLASTLAFAPNALAFAGAQNPAPLQQQPQSTVREADGVEDESGEKAEIRFEGLRAYGEKDVRKMLREERPGIDATFNYSPAKIEKAVRAIKDLLASRGFLNATVEVREERIATPTVITLVVNEGERARIADIRFEGNKFVPSAHLVKKMQGCLADEEGNWQDDYSADKIEYCLHTSAVRHLRGEGYLQAVLSKPRIEETKSGGIRIVVSVTEGLRYRLGKIKVKGATVFLPEQIVEMLEVKAGDVANGDKLFQNLSERLRDEYGDRGYIKYEFDIEPSFKRAAKKGFGVVDLKIELYEGKPFTIASVEFYGNRLKTVGELKSALSLGEGDVFSRRKLLDGLERLREMGVLHGSYENVEMNTNDEKTLIELRVKIDEGKP